MAGKRRGRGEDAVYFAHRTGTECKDEKNHKGCTGRWRGEIDLGRDGTGKRVRPKVSGRTKTIVKDKLDELHKQLDSGIKTSATYLVEDAVETWLDEGLDGRAAKTATTNREVLAPLAALIGKTKLREAHAHRRVTGAAFHSPAHGRTGKTHRRPWTRGRRPEHRQVISRPQIHDRARAAGISRPCRSR